MIIEAFRPCKRNTLRGFVRVRFPSGLILAEIGIHVSSDDDRAWASPPSRPMIDQNGTVMRDERGKVRYAGLVAFATAKDRHRWSDAIIAAVRAKHPEAFQ